MESLIFAINAVSPIILTVAVGYLLKKIGMMNGDFSKKANKLVFRVFLPVMLFMNIYGIENIQAVDFGYVIYSVTALLIIFAVALPSVMILTDKRKCRGALLQAVFRSNYALIGIPLASSLFPGEGAAVATLLSAFMIPVFNILAVIALSIFNNDGEKPDFKKVLLGIAKNPLILSILAGLAALGIRAILANASISFRISEIPAVWNSLKYLSNIATPLSLLVLGAQFEFSAIPALKKQIIFGIALRSVLIPSLALTVAYFIEIFDGASFAAFVAMFATPVAVSTVPMCQSMGADHQLAGQLVVWTTAISSVVIFLASFVLKAIGVFG